MLYFSKLRIIFISLISLFFILFASSNIFKFSNQLLNKKINLGLDLQGGSYLLLEIDNTPVIEQKLQNLTITIRNYFKEKNIRINNLKLTDQNLTFSVDEQFKQTILEVFTDKNSDFNPYYQRFKTHQLEIVEEKNIFIVVFIVRLPCLSTKDYYIPYGRSSLPISCCWQPISTHFSFELMHPYHTLFSAYSGQLKSAVGNPMFSVLLPTHLQYGLFALLLATQFLCQAV